MTLPKRIAQWWGILQPIALHHEVDPLLLAALMDRESLGGYSLTPSGPDGVGDNGHGRGLMQIDDRAHPIFCNQLMPDGTPRWADAKSNIEYGAIVFADGLRLFSLEPEAVAAYNAGPGAVRRALDGISNPAIGRPLPIETRILALDAITTGKDYVSDVLRRREMFKLPPQPKDSPPPPKPQD